MSQSKLTMETNSDLLGTLHLIHLHQKERYHCQNGLHPLPRSHTQAKIFALQMSTSQQLKLIQNTYLVLRKNQVQKSCWRSRLEMKTSLAPFLPSE